MPKLRTEGDPRAVRAFHANKGIEAWYRDQLQALLARANADMLRMIRAAYEETPPGSIMAQDARNPTVNVRRTLKAWGDKWIARFDKKSAELAEKFVGKSGRATDMQMRAALKSAGFTVKFKPTPAMVESYSALLAENVGLIKSIPSNYLLDVQGSVWRSVMRGGDLGTLTKEIQSKYAIGHRRAAFIARDQNNKAKAVLENTRRLELGMTQAMWRHSGGGKVPRPEHVAFSGKVYDLKKGAFLEGKWVWPGSEPNCRCTSRAIIPGVEY